MMFDTSTQKKFWILENCEMIAESQVAATKALNENFSAVCSGINVVVPSDFLAYHEEKLLLIHFSQFVIDICRKFKPSVPASVIGIALTYFKRFYLNTSVMEYHPRNVAYLCVYLACKVDEYNVSIDQFIGQVRPEHREAIHMFVIDHELLLLQKLNFHLTVHCPYRPLEGFLIDMKTKQNVTDIKNLETYRPQLEKFLMNSLLTDVCLLYPPSQIALAALSSAIGSTFKRYLQQLVDQKLFKKMCQKLEEIKEIATSYKNPTKLEIDLIEEKLKSCSDFENEPTSEFYFAREKERRKTKEIEKKRKYQELMDVQNSEERVLAADMTNY